MRLNEAMRFKVLLGLVATVTAIFLLLGIRTTSATPADSDSVISRPGETKILMVFRNGQFHEVKVPVVRKAVVKDGVRGETVEEDTKAAESQLPAFDPTYDHVGPTPEQAAEAMRRVGADSPPTTIPGSSDDQLPKSIATGNRGGEQVPEVDTVQQERRELERLQLLEQSHLEEAKRARAG